MYTAFLKERRQQNDGIEQPSFKTEVFIILNNKLDASLDVTTAFSSSRFHVVPVYDMLLNNMNTKFNSNCLLPVLICIEMIYNICPLSCCIVQSYNSQELDRLLIFRLSGIN